MGTYHKHWCYTITGQTKTTHIMTMKRYTFGSRRQTAQKLPQYNKVQWYMSK